MQPHRPFWFHLEESVDTLNDMVLTEEDGKAIIHIKEHGGSKDLTQQWEQHDDGTITNMGSSKYLCEDASKHGVLCGDKLKWHYDPVASTLTT